MQLLDHRGNAITVPSRQPAQPATAAPEVRRNALSFVYPAGSGVLNAKIQPSRIAYTGMLTLPIHGPCFIEGHREFASFEEDRAQGGSVAKLTLVRARDRKVVGEVGGVKLVCNMRAGDKVAGYVLATDSETRAVSVDVVERTTEEGTRLCLRLKMSDVKPARQQNRCV